MIRAAIVYLSNQSRQSPPAIRQPDREHVEVFWAGTKCQILSTSQRPANKSQVPEHVPRKDVGFNRAVRGSRDHRLLEKSVPDYSTR
jgi:hypothetical protein